MMERMIKGKAYLYRSCEPPFHIAGPCLPCSCSVACVRGCAIIVPTSLTEGRGNDVAALWSFVAL